MPLISPLWAATLQRHAAVLGALALFLLLTIVNQFWFRPAAARYARTVRQANELGMALDPTVASAFMPPRLYALLTDNSMRSEDATNMGNAGTLTAQVLEDLTGFTSARDIQVLSTEPGAVTQEERLVQVRAHLRARCRYGAFVGLLEDVSRSGKLIALDRFAMSPEESGTVLLDLWFSRLILKRPTGSR